MSPAGDPDAAGSRGPRRDGAGETAGNAGSEGIGNAAGEVIGNAAGEVLGLIAGNGRFPRMFAREARSRGHRIVAVGHRGETDEALEHEVDALTWVRVGQLGRMIRALKAAGVRRAVMAGGIDKVRSITQIRPDLRGMLFLRRVFAVSGHGDDALLRALADELQGEGIEIVPSTIYLESMLATAGRIAGPKPSSQQLSDVRTGCRVLAALGGEDVGQSVVVEHGVVLAVEAVEGTDEALRRAGRLGRGGAVVVKTAKRGQDMRFDVPAVGPATIATMVEARASVLAVEAGATLLIDRDDLVEAAARAGIAVLGCTADGAVAGLAA